MASNVDSSGYRSPEHPMKLVKDVGGMHTTGLACDVRKWERCSSF